MSINLSEKSSESLSEENILASQITQNKSHKLTNANSQIKEKNVVSNNYSEKEDLLVNNLITSSNIPKIEKKDNNEIGELNEINDIKNQANIILTLSPLKKGKKKNNIIDIMEKSKKNNNIRRRSVANHSSQDDIKFTEEIMKTERKDAFGVPINKRNKKKVKVTFSDTINKPNIPRQLVQVIPIASFKQYNCIEGLGLPNEENSVNNKSTCKCCLIY